MKPSRLALLAVALLGSACATNTAARRATVIARADAEARRAVAAEEQLDVARIPPGAVGVVPFVAPAGDSILTPLGYAVADLLVSDLGHSPALTLVERERLDAIRRELDLVEQGRVEAQTAPRVGRLIGARRLVIGDIQAAGQSDYVVRARIVDVIAGTVQEVASASAPFDRLFEAQAELAFRMYDALGVQLTPATRARIAARQAAQLAAVVAYGRALEAESRGDAAAAAQFYSQATQSDPAFVTQRYRAAAAQSGGGASGSLQRAIDLSVDAVNQAAPARVAEAADVPAAASSQILTLLLTVRITP